MAKLTKSDFKKLSNSFSDLLFSAGALLVELGKAEKKDSRYSALLQDMKKDPAKINELLTELPPEESTKMLGIILKLSLIIQSYKEGNMDKEQKLKMGVELQKISKELKEG